MKLSDAGAKLIKSFEGCKLTAYPDPKTGGDPWTIGWGHTGRDVKKGMTITQQQADDLFRQDVAPFENIVNDGIKVSLTQGQFDAMVSIVFNVGQGGSAKDGIMHLKSGNPSTLVRKLNAGDYQGAADEFPKWCSPGSNVEAGLKRRRNAERAMFLGAI